VRPLLRYLFAVAAVLAALGLRILLTPLTGLGAPFVLFFAATLSTSLFAGLGPGLLSLFLGLLVGAELFVLPAGFSLSQATCQGVLYVLDGLVVIYLSMQVRRAQRGLREANERFRLTIDEAPIGMALVTLDGRFVRVNRTLCEIVGYSAAELGQLRFQDITHPDDVDADVELAGRLARGEIQRCQLAKRYLRRDGSIVDVMLSSSTLRDRGNVPQYFITQIEDITERKRAERELRLSEAKFSGIISIAADAIICVDEAQRIVLFNEGAEKIFGYSKSEAIGSPLDLVIPERFRVAHRGYVAEFAAGAQVTRRMGDRQDVYGLRKSGEEFPAEASISKVVLGDERLLSVVLRDITAQKRVEEALRLALAAREQVLGVVAHDLRSPLSSILVTSTSLPREDERVRKAREVITRAASRMNRLIQDLLDVALVEAGQLRLATSALSSRELVEEAAEMERPLAASSQVEVRTSLELEPAAVRGDHDRLLQVFENLIGNAIKFTAAGGRVTVGAAQHETEVLFWVADTGCGIAPHDLDKVFDRFWQAAASTRRLGAGLGLPISKGIVEAHGGRIWVESTLGRGSTFYFVIPRAGPTEEWRAADAPAY
jgi:PAS domain S-box-containing protein